MPELKVRSILGALAASVLGIAASVGSNYIKISSINISIPFLIIAILLLYLVLNLFIYPKAKTIQLVKISISSLLLFFAIISISTVISGFIATNAVSIKPNFNISASPVFYAFTTIFGLLTTIILLKIEKTQKTESIKQSSTVTENIPQEIIKEEFVIIKNEEPVAPIQTQNSNFNIPEKTENTINTQPSEIYEEVTREQFIEKKDSEKEIKQETRVEETKESLLEGLDILPDIKLEESQQPKEKDPNSPYDESIFELDDNDIPDNIRLSNNVKTRQTAASGVIASIGKLLINHRDIENIIETNELMQQIGCSSEEVDIISMTEGIKIYEKFNKVMVEYTQVKDLTLSNKAGFTIASIIQDGRKSETIGAIASGAFLVLKNYLARLEINDIQKVFFETENSIHSLFKVDDFILFFISEKSFDPINYTLVKDVLDQSNISNQDLSIIKNIKGVVESTITDKDGSLIGSINCENPKILAALSSAIFENLKVFIMNIEPGELEKITIFSQEKTYTIRKYNDKISGLITSAEGPVKLSDQIIEIEELIK